MPVGYLASFGIALLASLLLTPLVRAVARKTGFVAKPRADRWHKKPTALMGGVGIYLGFIASYLILRRPGEARGLLVVCASGMFVLGFVDDLLHLKPYAKLVVQIAAAAALTMFGLSLPYTGNYVVDQAITIFWLIGITNALNLLDNIDGLSSGIAAIAAAFMVYFFHTGGQMTEAKLCAAFCGAVLGFLVYNFNPASIFMGDSGSLFLGFFLGGVGLLSTGYRTRNLLSVVAVPILVLLIPILDTTLVTVTRKLSGRPVSQGGRDHTSHRLVALGLSERSATLVLYAFAIASGLVAVAARSFTTSVIIGLVPVFALVVVFLAVYLARVRVYKPIDETTESGGGRALLPTLADFTYKRRIFEVLHDLVIIILAYYGAFLLRFEGALVTPFYQQFLRSLPLVIVVQMSVFLGTGLYRGLWRYTSIGDLTLFVRTAVGSVVLTVLGVLFVFRFDGFSRAVFIIDGILLFGFIAGSRLSFRMLRAWFEQRSQAKPESRKILVYGAGDAGELFLRECQQNNDLALFAVGILDDDPLKRGRVIHGVKVLGTGDELGPLVAQHQVRALVISTSKLPGERLELIQGRCAELGIECRRMRISLD
jgi:UDP-GlcNAc:undecaprenyl-phosphate GlcNAc-1-phosphate transferase